MLLGLGFGQRHGGMQTALQLGRERTTVMRFRAREEHEVPINELATTPEIFPTILAPFALPRGAGVGVDGITLWRPETACTMGGAAAY